MAGAITLLLMLAALSGVQESADFLTTINSVFRTTGFVEATYAIEEPGKFGKVVIGVDAATGAFYRIHGGRVTGRAADGRYFHGLEGEEVVHYEADHQGAAVWDRALDLRMPVARMLLCRLDPSSVRSFQVKPDGGLTVTVAFDDCEKRFEFTSEGHPERLTVDTGNGEPIVTEYGPVSPKSPEEMPLVAAQGEWVLESVTFLPEGGPARCVPEVVEQIALAAKTKYQRKSIPVDPDAPPVERVRPEDGPSEARPGTTLAQYRWPLVLTGVGLIVVAIVAIMRRTA